MPKEPREVARNVDLRVQSPSRLNCNAFCPLANRVHLLLGGALFPVLCKILAKSPNYVKHESSAGDQFVCNE